MKNIIKIYVYQTSNVSKIKTFVSERFKHPVVFKEQKTSNPISYYDNWLQIESDYPLWALSKKLDKIFKYSIKTITYPKYKGKDCLNGEEVIEKLRQKQIQTYHPELTGKI